MRLQSALLKRERKLTAQHAQPQGLHLLPPDEVTQLEPLCRRVWSRVEDRVEKLVRLHCQHAPAVSEHPEAAWLYGKVSALNWFILCFFGRICCIETVI